MGNAPVVPGEELLRFPGLSEAEAAERLRRFRGLTRAEAAERLRQFGANELPSARRRGIARLLGEVLREPMLILLLICAGLYLSLGDLTESLVLLGSVVVIIGISLYQTQRTEKALHALRDLSSPRALVRRDDREERIPGRDVVPGDLVVLAEGDRVPADAVVLWAVNLRTDESLLTGESEPVNKSSGGDDLAMSRPGGDDSPFVFSGTLVVGGHGLARVKGTGFSTEIGRIGTALQSADNEKTKLERDTARLVRFLFGESMLLCAALALLLGIERGQWAEGLLAGVALAMSMIPEEFPVILTIFLALGAWRISHRRVLTRRLPAIEALGSATVLCVDKTGTLTQNRMAVSLLAAGGRYFAVEPVASAGFRTPREKAGEPLPEEFHALLEYAVLASQQNPFDPMEQAINVAGRRLLAGSEHLHPHWSLVREYPLSRELLAVTHAWSSREGGGYVIGAKGAPEAVADLCHLPEERRRALAEEVGRMADQGLRLLGVARGVATPASLPSEQQDLEFEFLGLLALADPIREGVPAALAECYRAGIRTVMLTGDYPRTAQAVAERIGLRPHDQILTGADLERMDEDEWKAHGGRVNVFARVVPEQKLRLVQALKSAGEVVAMTGDGVNDAPALKAADIGVAMGGRGTDVAREAAALVLLDDDFSSIVAAVRLGRRILDNIRKAMAYVVAVHVPIAALALLPVLFGWPLVLLPLHIVFLELIIDPACSVAFEAEPEEDDVMARPPRDPQQSFLQMRDLVHSLLQGGIIIAVVFGALVLARQGGAAEERTRLLGFSILVLGNLALILAQRSPRHSIVASLLLPNPALLWVIAAAGSLLALSLEWPPARHLLRLADPSGADLATIGASAIAILGCLDLLKWLARSVGPRPRTEASDAGGRGA